MKRITLTFIFLSIGLMYGQTIETVAGNGFCCGGADGIPATSSTVYYPNGVFVDAIGNIFIAEANKIRKVNTVGIITTIAGSVGGYSGDGGPATSALLEADAVLVDPAGNIYVADGFHSVIRKINTSGIISTIAGTGTNGFAGDGGLAISAQLNGPNGLARDATGNLYIADTDNNRIRKISTSGIITTVAGNGVMGYSGDGVSATSSKLYNPIGITIDPSGNLLIADYENNRIRKVNASGIISTIAGTGTPNFSGDGASAILAELNTPSAVACDNLGNIFIGDYANNRIRMINSSGVIQTIAGGAYGFNGDGGPAISAEFKGPWSISTDQLNDLFIADKYNHRIRKITNVVGVFEEASLNNQLSIYPNPSNGAFYIESNSKVNQSLKVFDVNGKLILNQDVENQIMVDLTFLNNGVYSINIQSIYGTVNKKLVIVK